MRWTPLLVVWAFAAWACSSSVSPPPSTTAATTAAATSSPVPIQSFAADCVNPPTDIRSLTDVADPVACYGNAPLTLDAYLVGGVADCPIVVEPAWLACPQTFLMLVGETRKVGAPMLTAAIDPASGASDGGQLNTNVRVTGHFDDPAAQTCRETQRAPAIGGTPEPMADTIARCRRTFVITETLPIKP